MTLDEFILAVAATRGMGPAERARALGPLAKEAGAVLGRARAEAMAEAVEGGMSQAEVADFIGSAPAQVSKAFTQHGLSPAGGKWRKSSRTP